MGAESRNKGDAMETGQSVRASAPIVASVALAVAVAAACSDNRNPVAPTGAGKTLTSSHASVGEMQTFPQGDPELGPEIAAIRAATVQFHDVNAAIAAGYADPAGRPTPTACSSRGIQKSAATKPPDS